MKDTRNPRKVVQRKLLEYGASHLSDAELLMMLLDARIGPDRVATELLNGIGHDLHQLSGLTVGELRRVHGLGESQALRIVSAMELGRRRDRSSSRQRPGIRSSADAFQLIRPELKDLRHEEFWALYLNRNHRLLFKRQISRGGVSGTVVDPKLIFKFAVDHLASAVIVAHNHPSGHLRPSTSDIRLTEKLAHAGKVLEIPLLDHLILNSDTYLSFADEQLISETQS